MLFSLLISESFFLWQHKENEFPEIDVIDGLFNFAGFNRKERKTEFCY